MNELPDRANRELPGGTVTFLFTDIEGSTKLLEDLGKNYARLLAEHHLILRNAFGNYHGREIDTQGDSFFASFPRASDAVAAVIEVQRSLAEHDWPQEAPVRVRMGLHTGEPWLVDEGYIGMDVHRAARIAHVGYGGQVLLSETTTSLVRDDLPASVGLLDLGYHMFKDMRRPERIHQLTIEGLPSDFPPIKSLEALPPTAGALDLDAAMIKREVGPCPYRGLVAFREQDAPFFFGRETFTDLIEESVEQKGLVAVIVGPSGSGKSSVVFAGLLPSLNDDPSWHIVQIRPGDNPFLSLASSLAPAISQGLEGVDLLLKSKKLAAALAAAELSLHELVNDILDRQPTATRLLLVVDQFEELFTLTQDEAERRRFLIELLDSSEKGALRRPPSFVLLLTLRADFMGQALAYRPFADALQDGSLMLGPMNRAELKMAIEKPAELQGAAFETGLVERLLDDVGEEPGNLPLLEFALTLLWEQMDVGWMTHAIYDEIGRVDGALARYADEIYTGLDLKGQNEIRRMFIQLIQPGRGTEDTRRVAARDELSGIDWDLIQFLADKRLIVTSRNEAGSETVEVVHEALIRSWKRLREWIDADRAFRSWQEELRSNLRQWESTGQDKGALLRGAPLIQAEEWLVNRTGDLSPAETAYIRASLERDQMIRSRRVRRRRFIFAGLALGLVVAVILSIFALSQRNSAMAESEARATQQSIAENEAHARATQQFLAESESEARATQQSIAEGERARAEEEQARAEDAAVEIADQKTLIESQARESLARNLATYALDKINIDPQLSLLLALEAANQTYPHNGTLVPEAHESLLLTLPDVSRLSYMIPAQDIGIPYVSFTSDGSRLIARYFRAGTQPQLFPNGTTTLIYDAFTGQLLHTLPKGIAVGSLTSTPHIGIVEPAGDELILTLWNPLNGTNQQPKNLAIPVTVEHGDLEALILNPDATILCVVWLNGRYVQVWDLQTVTELPSLNLTITNPPVPYLSSEVGAFIKNGVPSIVAFSSDGTELYSIADTIFPETYSPRMQRHSLQPFERHPTSIGLPRSDNMGSFYTRLSLSANQKWYTIIGDDHSEIRDFVTTERLRILYNSRDAFINSISFSPSSTTLATASTDGMIAIWDLANLADERSIQQKNILSAPGISIHDMQFTPDDQMLATVSSDGAIRVWNLGPGGALKLPLPGRTFSTEEEINVSIALNPAGKQLALADLTGYAAIYDLEGDPGAIQLGDFQDQPVGQMEYSPEGTTIATCRFAGPFQIWDASSGVELLRLDDLTDGDCSFAFHPDGNSVFLGFFKNGSGWHMEVGLPVLEPGTLMEVEPLRSYDWLAPHAGATTSLAFEEQSSALAVVSGHGELFVWDTEVPVGVLPVGGSTSNVDPADSEALLIRENKEYIEALIDPTNAFLVVTALDGSVTVINLGSSQIIGSIKAHEGPITAVSFSPDFKHLATAGSDLSIKLWDIDTGDSLLNLPGLPSTVTDLEFSPEGNILYAASSDGAVRPYLLDIDELMALAQSKATRTLTDEECRKYLYLESCPES